MRTAFSIFAGNRGGSPFSVGRFGANRSTESERVNSRLDSLHKALFGDRPKTRFFRH